VAHQRRQQRLLERGRRPRRPRQVDDRSGVHGSVSPQWARGSRACPRSVTPHPFRYRYRTDELIATGFARRKVGMRRE
jgi:hypothetical protein